ncbi:hypothetical protein LWI29_000867 [Acer saccharum]|uniref:Uncharacterized protein n=1 Tax=Acer saccharum TaxID=4024 RepID=A0AA39VVW4_ACESA|nr:hypothetical protein LWI29_000867 [Acer saccharum]
MLPSSSPVLSHSVFPSSAIFIAQQITIQLRRSWSVESRFFFVVVRRSSASLQSLVSSLHSPVTILHSLQIAADPRQCYQLRCGCPRCPIQLKILMSTPRNFCTGLGLQPSLWDSLFTFSLMYLNPLGKPQAMISEEEANEQSNQGGTKRKADSKTISTGANNTREMESSQSNATGVTEDRLQLLGIVTGAFRPGVLTAVMGVTGWMF